jgi:deazaflavin-dependent oxidoreductase (nitroreductase family)
LDETLTQPQFLYLTTVGWKTGKEHGIEIWFVEHNKKYYVISELGKSAHWIRNISYNPRITFSIDGTTFDGAARIVNPIKEGQLASEISELMDIKYKWNQGLIVELRPLTFSKN